ncbi:MAG: cytidylate kinase-like family protein [Lachnospiraceae bacterium]|nr:cytidylate kinase-like family protein [Lachnospiraceae bacterium]
MIITLNRVCGSKGGKIAEALAKKYDLTFVDHYYLIKKAKEEGCFDEMVQFFSGAPGSFLYSVDFDGEETSEQGLILTKIRKLMPKDNFIVVGCCGNHILRKEDAFTIFISSKAKQQIDTVCQFVDHVENEEDAREYIKQMNGRRRLFHEAFTGEDWDSPRNYDLCLNGAAYEFDDCVGLIMNAIEKVSRS